jgi:hypothetical protein
MALTCIRIRLYTWLEALIISRGRPARTVSHVLLADVPTPEKRGLLPLGHVFQNLSLTGVAVQLVLEVDPILRIRSDIIPAAAAPGTTKVSWLRSIRHGLCLFQTGGFVTAGRRIN